MTISDLFAMGGYGAYVWSAYGITLTVFGINIFFSLREKKRVKQLLETYHES